MASATTFFFPTLFLYPAFDEPSIDFRSFGVIKRQWNTSLFDVANLATNGGVNLPYQVMDVFLHKCNLEIAINDAHDHEDAFRKLCFLRVALYISGVPPFISPFVTTHSVNDYSGICGPPVETLPERKRALRTGNANFAAWPKELTFSCVLQKDRLALSLATLERAAMIYPLWMSLCEKQRSLNGFNESLLAAPNAPSLGQSILHMWCSIEALFPSVSTEVSFRIALYLTQLTRVASGRREFFDRVKSAYTIRSKIAHGSKPNASFQEWSESWNIFVEVAAAIATRGSLPSESDLLCSLLDG